STSFEACSSACRSDPQMPQASVRTRTSPGPGTGSGRVSTTRRELRITAARMGTPGITRVPARVQGPRRPQPPRRLASWDTRGPRDSLSGEGQEVEMTRSRLALLATLALATAAQGATTPTVSVTRVD